MSALMQYLELLERWNARTNLTAVRGKENIVTRHFGESLFAAAQLLGSIASQTSEPREFAGPGEQRRFSVIDVGSGAGFPGLPIKIYAPSVSLTLIESQNKKATFLKEVIRALHLKDASVYNGRAETCELRADLVTIRAVEQFERVLPVAARLVRRSTLEKTLGSQGTAGNGCRASAPGRLALLIGAGQREAAEDQLPGFSWDKPVNVPLSSERVLLVGRPAPTTAGKSGE